MGFLSYKTAFVTIALLLRMDDGVIWLVMVSDSITRWEMFQFLMNADKALHVGKPGVEMVPVRAFRVVPIQPKGHMSIDGESFHFGPVQGQILPSRAKVFSSYSTA